MGNSSSSGRGQHEDTVDFGHLTPQGIYTGPRDWNQQIVASLIVERRLGPFYRPLEDYEEGWSDERILAARKDSPDPDASGSPTQADPPSSIVSSRSHHKRSSASKEPARFSEGMIYRGAVECPICFLYYPPNINHSRCCDQAICTECFVQIKRAEPTTTHLVSEPAACPYCMQENFGVTYTPPVWRAGLGSDGSHSPSRQDFYLSQMQPSNPEPLGKRRRKSFGADSPEVVTIDQIRPDWEQKLAAVRAAVTRRANRRIIMRQVGDRLIPVGVTSGRVHAIQDGGEGSEEGGEGGGGRRRRRDQYPGAMNIAGHDLEEIMLMEAMRLSLLDEEERQRKEREEQRKKGQSSGESEVELPTSTSSTSGTIPVSGGSNATAVAASSSPPPAPLPVLTTSDVVSATTSSSHSRTSSSGAPAGSSDFVPASAQPSLSPPAAPSSAAAASAIAAIPETPSVQSLAMTEPSSTAAVTFGTAELMPKPHLIESSESETQVSVESTASSLMTPEVSGNGSYATLLSSPESTSDNQLSTQPL